MQTYYHPDHIHHDPGVLPQPVGGSAGYYSEVAERGVLLHDAVRTADFGPIAAPSDHGLAPIHAVHGRSMVHFIRTAYDRMATETGREHVVVPENFAVWRAPARVGKSIWAELGHYCYDTSSPIFARTWDAAYWSAQCAVNAAAEIDRGAPVAYALCRPPGHHAGPDLYGGFCYLNNAAIAAQWLAGKGARVAIVDVDYHHGNGTQAVFYARNDVLFCSVHADPDADYPFYWGFADERGEDAGLGYNLNIPLPLGTDVAGYLAALDHALGYVGNFGADVLVLSLGFDTYVDDPVGGFRLTTADYAAVGARLAARTLPTVVVQEGGYCRPALAANVTSFFTGLLGG
jgi:acetoin utilization deacetylase AcuC-like enzyme